MTWKNEKEVERKH